MKRELRDRWCEALRSGEYQQGQHHNVQVLADTRYFCCLGVLGDIQGAEWNIGVMSSPDTFKLDEVTYEGEAYIPNGPSDDKQTQLAHKNDTDSTFEEIADWIEENVPVTD